VVVMCAMRSGRLHDDEEATCLVAALEEKRQRCCSSRKRSDELDSTPPALLAPIRAACHCPPAMRLPLNDTLATIIASLIFCG